MRGKKPESQITPSSGKNGVTPLASGGGFFDSVVKLVERARAYVGRTADLTTCVTYFEVGRMIVEEEQGGKARAEYGRELLKDLSAYLTDRLGRGFSFTNLKNAKKFYLIYAPQVGHSLDSLLGDPEKGQSRTGQFIPPQKSQSIAGLFKVSWTHYVVLTRIKKPEERRFYKNVPPVPMSIEA